MESFLAFILVYTKRYVFYNHFFVFSRKNRNFVANKETMPKIFEYFGFIFYFYSNTNIKNIYKEGILWRESI